jgi:hypothetical protein
MAALCFGSIPDIPQSAIRNVEPVGTEQLRCGDVDAFVE